MTTEIDHYYIDMELTHRDPLFKWEAVLRDGDRHYIAVYVGITPSGVWRKAKRGAKRHAKGRRP